MQLNVLCPLTLSAIEHIKMCIIFMDVTHMIKHFNIKLQDVCSKLI
jgi:hypothetical protein